MRRLPPLVVAGLALIAVPAMAQEAATRCTPVAPVRVTVATTAGPSLQGTLLCLTGSEVVLASGGTVTSTPLADVRRIDTKPDPVWDGALKGAVLPIVMWLVFCPQCEAGPMLRAAAAYGAIGATWDALDTNQTRIYERTPRAAIGWRVRF